MKELNYRPAVLESIARETLKKYDAALVVGEPRAIPIEQIIEKQLGLSIEYHRIRKNGLILGCTIFDDTLVAVYDAEISDYTLVPVERGTILLDESLLRSRTDGRLRFTCAHEAAHWLIHRELYSGSGTAAAFVNPKTSLEDDSVNERQADILGTALLMPSGQVKRAYYKYRGQCAGGEIPAALAELFGVSKQAMDIFLKDHRLS
jgi:hypothetical protein